MSKLSPAERVNSCWFIVILEDPSWESEREGDEWKKRIHLTRRQQLRLVGRMKLQKEHIYRTYHLPNPHVTLPYRHLCLPGSKHHCLSWSWDGALLHCNNIKQQYQASACAAVTMVWNRKTWFLVPLSQTELRTCRWAGRRPGTASVCPASLWRRRATSRSWCSSGTEALWRLHLFIQRSPWHQFRIYKDTKTLD